jgi:hypothetical protein
VHRRRRPFVTGIMAALICAAQSGGASGGDFTVSATPGYDFTKFRTSDPITATVSGGTGPFTYEWKLVSGPPLVTIDSPTANVTTFTAVGNGERDVSAVCSVLDTATGKSTNSNNVDLVLNSGVSK